MQKLNVTLVGQGPDVSSRSKTLSYAPLSLKGYLDFHLQNKFKNDVNVQMLDFEWKEMPDTLSVEILKTKPDIVGFSTYLWNYDKFLECSKNIKTAKKDILVILGGPQVSPIAEEVMVENREIDVIPFVPISGEVILCDIVEAVAINKELSSVNGICYRASNGDICKTSPRVRTIDYTNTPSPYSDNNKLFELDVDSMVVIESSRGCPYGCGYCFWGHGSKEIKYFNLERVLRDIEIIYNNSRVKHVYFSDSNFLSNLERAEIILRYILKQKFRIKTDFELSVISLKESTLKLLNSLPFFSLLIAVQSTNPEALKYIGGFRPTPQFFIEKLDKIKQWVPDINYRIDIMLGLPGDDFAGFMQTLDFALSLEPYYMVLSYPVYLLPGSRFFEEKDSWRLRYNSNPPFAVMETPTFPHKDIERALRVAIWVQILTFYYPAIAKFFYSSSRVDGVRIKRILSWIKEIESRVNIFDSHENLSTVATKSLAKWNECKKYILEKASTTKVARIIYSAINYIESGTIRDRLKEDIELGNDIFEYMSEQGMDSVGFDSLPDCFSKFDNFNVSKGIFSIYKS